ncbi:MAG: ubiquinol-cytochrome c reductase iron-sulfur subunit [Deltaproteobacteria bacterium]|nr:ubiquinol-cytochrome c reductase iron-sulfur subunit [Deltaproteobacteria bacterium]
MTTSKLNPERSGAQPEDRRKFIAVASALVLGIAGGLMGLFNLIFLRPRVTYGAPSKVRVGKPESYSPGSTIELPADSIVVKREGDSFMAISTVCTHLGCTVKATEIGFDCPCHGSSYDSEGNVVAGPAPKALSWYRISLTPNGELEVDKQQVVKANTYMELPS